MHLAEIWRYPVKSMGGERLISARVFNDGIEGDRLVQVYDGNGRVTTSRPYPDLLGLHPTLGTGGEPLVDGQPWRSGQVSRWVREIVGPQAVLRFDHGNARFDVLPLLVATDASIAAFGRGGRRLRPNIVVGGAEGLAERAWEGGQLTTGNVIVGIRNLRGRCAMTTFDPDTLEHDPSVLRDIVKRFGGKLALNCEVAQAGVFEIGMAVEVRRRTGEEYMPVPNANRQERIL